MIVPYTDPTPVRQEIFLGFLRRGDDLEMAATKAERAMNFIQYGALMSNADLMDLGYLKPEPSGCAEDGGCPRRTTPPVAP